MVTRVGVLGAGGRMGALVCETVAAPGDLVLAAAVDPNAAGESAAGVDIAVQISKEPDAFVDAGVEVAVDFTHPDSAAANLRWCIEHGIHAVVGTSGFTQERLDEVRAVVGDGPPNAIVVPNFAIGAVVLMRLAELAAPYFDRAEVIEYHHDGKADAPSGTAFATAAALGSAREWPERGDSTEFAPGARGALVDGVRVHAVRLPGIVADEDVIFGAQGQSLTFRHVTTDRSAFMPGVVLAVREVPGRAGLTVGLAALLDL